MTTKDSLGDRIKKYEDAYRFHLPHRMPIIIRCDGKSFHSFTKKFKKPFDSSIISAMWSAGLELMKNIQGAKLCYIQSDEISILLNNFETYETSPWFDCNLQKTSSVAASIATAAFNRTISSKTDKLAFFDARSFILPKEEVVNYFYWRQSDAMRNSVSMVAQSNFSHKVLQNKNTKQMKEMLLKKGIDWDQLPIREQRGSCVVRNIVEKSPGVIRSEITIDPYIPIFIEDRDYINKLLEVKDNA